MLGLARKVIAMMVAAVPYDVVIYPHNHISVNPDVIRCILKSHLTIDEIDESHLAQRDDTVLCIVPGHKINGVINHLLSLGYRTNYNDIGSIFDTENEYPDIDYDNDYPQDHCDETGDHSFMVGYRRSFNYDFDERGRGYFGDY